MSAFFSVSEHLYLLATAFPYCSTVYFVLFTPAEEVRLACQIVSGDITSKMADNAKKEKIAAAKKKVCC